MSQYAEFMLFAHEMADKCSLLTLQYLKRGEIIAETKPDGSPVTDLDKRLEERLRAMLAKKFPCHGILGEEYGPENPEAEFVWVIDPLDGTRAFLAGLPVYGTLISLAHKGRPVLGIIDHPLTNDRWSGMEGAKSTHNGIPVSTRACPNLSDAVLSLGTPDALGPDEETAFKRLRQQAKWGIYGGNCYVYGRLSMGRVDICLDSGLKPWDFCALAPVIQGAGGMITDWEGKALTLASGPRVVACGDSVLHRKALDILSR